GTRLRRLPKEFRGCRRLLLCTWSHEPGVVSADTCLIALNETLQSSAVFLQAYSDVIDDSEIAHIPFPFTDDPKNDENADPAIGALSRHPSLLTLKEKLSLNTLCGYVTLLRLRVAAKVADENVPNSGDPMDPSVNSTSSTTKDPRKVPSSKTTVVGDQPLADWTLFDCSFGIPLFDQQLNRAVCAQMRSHQLFDASKRADVQFANRHLSLTVLDFIERFQPAVDAAGDDHRVPYPIRSLLFDGSAVRICDS
uniref:FAM91 C-terminal domain-containing protein n=1 Tax=Plectus sambesii TaxID=2011161 RepID=A0A914UTS4_9BILA